MKKYVGRTTGKMDWTVNAQLDGVVEYPLPPRHDVANHSPDGFAWGYGGSGPAQLALAILMDAVKDQLWALSHYQSFKSRFIAPLDKDSGWEMTEDQVKAWVEEVDPGYLRRGHLAWKAGDVETYKR